MTHCREAESADKLWAIVGKPTLTTEPSMKARPEARIVVASTLSGCATGAAGFVRCAVVVSQ